MSVVRGIQSFGFGFRALKKFPELWPLAVIIGGACGLGTGYSLYSITTKTDVVVKKGPERWENVDQSKNPKLINIGMTFRKESPSLENLRQELREAYS